MVAERIRPGVIDTGRLRLRPFARGDAGAMYANWASDPEVTRFLTWPAHASAAVTEAVLDGWIETAEPVWCIELRETGEPIGSISIVSGSAEQKRCEVGYCIGRAWWGRGYTAEALRALIGWLFDRCGLSEITAKHDTENPNSGRVMQKAGMRCTGIGARAARNNLGVRDMAYYSISRERA